MNSFLKHFNAVPRSNGITWFGIPRRVTLSLFEWNYLSRTWILVQVCPHLVLHCTSPKKFHLLLWKFSHRYRSKLWYSFSIHRSMAFKVHFKSYIVINLGLCLKHASYEEQALGFALWFVTKYTTSLHSQQNSYFSKIIDSK